MIPVQRPYLDDVEVAAVAGVFATRWLGMGTTTAEFEARLRALLGVKHVLAVNTGTAALHLALVGLDLSVGAQVLVPSLTFVATVQAIMVAGAEPVFCEVDPDTLNIDVPDAARRLTERTRAILPVHYAGLACDMDALLPWARARNLAVVEDAAHAFGSSYKGRKIGTLGDVTCFSFDPIKNITCGEGGAVVTDRDDIAKQVVMKRVLGIDPEAADRTKYERWWAQVTTTGFRYHMSNVNAAIGLKQLERMDTFKSRKQEIIRRYDEAFRDLPGIKLLRHSDEAFPFFYVVRVGGRRRQAFRRYLKERGIETGVHYVPNHLQPLFAERRVSLPITEQLFQEIVTLPMYFEMTDRDVSAVMQAVRAFVREHPGR
jgi:perosamine synthetase